ncbi:MAG TPA: hypothetical protein VN791_06865 [Acidimicrobiales bacterium]|nr:hypothetical protein [Acidimicrobiales bacterium]
MSRTNSEKAEMDVSGFVPSSVSIDATWTKLTPSANRKLAYRSPSGRPVSSSPNTLSISAWFSSAASGLVRYRTTVTLMSTPLW